MEVIVIKNFQFISTVAMPLIILIIILFGIRDKKNIFDLFLIGAKKGMEITIRIFPTLIGLFFAIGLLRESGIIDFFTKILSPILKFIKFPEELVPLAILRPISGSASMAVATDIIKNNGVDSIIGLIASVIMGSTETTLYTIAVYSSSVNIKDTKKVLIASLAADVTGIVVSTIICSLLFNV